MVWKNITDDEICETFNIDKEILVLDRVKKMPDDIIKKIFQYVKSPLHIEIKNEIEYRQEPRHQFNDFLWISNWRAKFNGISPTDYRWNNKYTERMFDYQYQTLFYGFPMDLQDIDGDFNIISACSYDLFKMFCIKTIRKIGYENGVKGRSKKDIIQKLMKL